MSDILPPGSKAPGFTLRVTPDQNLSLSEFAGRRIILAFYPADWSPVCGDELALFNELRDEWARYDAQVVGISVDGVWCHQAYREHRKLWIPLLSDFEPKGEVSKRFGVYRATDGTSERALFVLRPDGVIAWRYVSSIDVNPGAEGIIDALDHMRAEAA